MLYLFLIIIVLGLLAAMLTAFAKLIRDLGELAIIYKNGRYYENENSEDWEEFEYEISEDERFK